MKLQSPLVAWRTVEGDFASVFAGKFLFARSMSDDNGKSKFPDRGAEADGRKGCEAVRPTLEDVFFEIEICVFVREASSIASFCRVLGFPSPFASSVWLVCGRFRLAVEGTSKELCLWFLVELTRRK